METGGGDGFVGGGDRAGHETFGPVARKRDGALVQRGAVQGFGQLFGGFWRRHKRNTT